MVEGLPVAFQPGSPMLSLCKSARKEKEVFVPLAPSLLAPAPVRRPVPQFFPSWFQLPLLSLPLRCGSSKGSCAWALYSPLGFPYISSTPLQRGLKQS